MLRPRPDGPLKGLCVSSMLPLGVGQVAWKSDGGCKEWDCASGGSLDKISGWGLSGNPACFSSCNTVMGVASVADGHKLDGQTSGYFQVCIWFGFPLFCVTVTVLPGCSASSLAVILVGS